MSFTSLRFLVFLGVFLIVYYVVPEKLQKYVLLAGNLLFYAQRGIAGSLFLLSGIVVTYFSAIAIDRRLWGKRKLWAAIGAAYPLGILFLLKYLGFFADTLTGLLGGEGVGLFQFFVPVGISFFSFSMAGYIFDVYAGRISAESNFVDYASFVSFFPAILAGPVGRAREFLPQLRDRHRFDSDQVKSGFLRFLWGCLKKMALADNIGLFVDSAYSAPESVSGGIWLVVVVFYSFQIYFDFAAYSDMALGTAEMLGFQLTENFTQPYFSQSVKSFWKKWHISLTSWFREYLYFPMGGSRVPRWRNYINILIVFAVSGLWHGAALQFLVWGLLNGLYQVAGAATSEHRLHLRQTLRIQEDGRLLRMWQTLVTFGLITFSWIFFRAASLDQAVFIIKRILLILRDGFSLDGFLSLGLSFWAWLYVLALFFVFLAVDWLQARKAKFPALSRTILPYWCTVFVIAFAIALFGVYGAGFDPQEFVYFKF